MKLLWQRDGYVCQEMVELITDYLAGALTRSQRRRFEAHIAACEHCSEYLEQMRATIALTGRLAAEDLSEEMRGDFTALYRKWRAEEDA
jgi:anti-sigma factor RsiW